MSSQSYVPPPAAGDVLRAAGAHGWPGVVVGGVVVEGAAVWRAAVQAADGPARLALWRALQDQTDS
jgi:hypothetical protein